MSYRVLEGSFPDFWWSLTFMDFSTSVPRTEILRPTPGPSNPTPTSIRPPFIPQPRPGPVSVTYLVYAPIDLPATGPRHYTVHVVLARWLSAESSFPRAKLFVRFALDGRQSSPWRFIEMRLPDVTIRPEMGPSAEDIGVYPIFRSFNPRILRNPFARVHREENGYPGEWYLSFWGVYRDDGSRRGLFFFWDDHQLDPFDPPEGPGLPPAGFAPAAIRVDRLEEGSLRLQMVQFPPIDDVPVSPGLHVIGTYAQSGNLLFEETAGLDWYDFAKRYGVLVRSAPVVVNRAGNPVPAYHRNLPLALMPHGQFERWPPCPNLRCPIPGLVSGDLRGQHVNEILTYFRQLLEAPQKPAMVSFANAWSTPCDPGPSTYAGIRPGYRALIKAVQQQGGAAFGYVIPNHVSRLWSGKPPNRYDVTWVVRDVQGNPAEGVYCYQSSEMARINRDFVGRVLNRTAPAAAFFDAIHYDGIGPYFRCSDHGANPRNHGHRGMSNEQLSGMRRDLAAAHAFGTSQRPVVLDQEVPLEALMDLFESAGAEIYEYANIFDRVLPPTIGPPAMPPLFRIAYGNAIRYTVAIDALYGHNPATLSHPIWDLHRLTCLKDGVIPVIGFFDDPTTFFHNPGGFTQTTDLLRSYARHYDTVLKPWFDGQVLRLPSHFVPPPCGIQRHRQISIHPLVSTPLVLDHEWIVKAAAYGRTVNGRPQAAIVMVDWGMNLERVDWPPFRGGSALPAFRRTLCSALEGYYQHNMDPPTPNCFAPSHVISLILRAQELWLLPDTNYRMTLHTLHPTMTEVRPIGTFINIWQLPNAQPQMLRVDPSRMSILVIEEA